MKLALEKHTYDRPDLHVSSIRASNWIFIESCNLTVLTPLQFDICVIESVNNPLGVSTDVGRVVINLDKESTPKTCKIFRDLCVREHGYGYQYTSLHRIVPDYIIQGGDVSVLSGQRKHARNLATEFGRTSYL